MINKRRNIFILRAFISKFWSHLRPNTAKLNEYDLLYALLIFQPVTGLADALFRGRPFALFRWQVPKFLPADRALANLFAEMHHIGAYALLLLIGGHALAALFHRFVLRDKVFQRMMLRPTAVRVARLGRRKPRPLVDGQHADS